MGVNVADYSRHLPSTFCIGLPFRCCAGNETTTSIGCASLCCHAKLVSETLTMLTNCWAPFDETKVMPWKKWNLTSMWCRFVWLRRSKVKTVSFFLKHFFSRSTASDPEYGHIHWDAWCRPDTFTFSTGLG